MKTWIRLAAAAALLAAGGAHAQTVLRLAHYLPESHPMAIASRHFAEQVAKRSNGALKVDIFANQTLGNPDEIMQQTQRGAIDMALPTEGQLGKFEKAFAAVMLPFLFDDAAHARRALDGPMHEWLAPIARHSGFELLGTWEYGFRDMTTKNKAINSPDDVKGLKIRTPPEVQLESAMAALGANVQKINFNELYLALSQGVVDGEENPIPTIYSVKLYEVQKHLALTHHMYQGLYHVISTKTWAKLNGDQRKILMEASVDAGRLERQLMDEKMSGDLAQLEKHGMQVTRPDLKPFRALMGPAYEKIAAYAGADNVKRVEELAAKARSR
jgi:TRAP-type transport system periplasmic protein